MSISVIIPAYNEETNLNFIFNEVKEELEKIGIDYEIIVVDDGSSDRTLKIAEKLQNDFPRTIVVSHKVNSGSGMAIRTGIKNANKDLVIYVPADGQFAINEIGAFVASAANADIVIGARMARSDYSWFRLLSSKTFIFLANNLFQQKFKDVNWVHLWKREIFENIQPLAVGVFFLEEVLVRATRKGYKIVEIDSQYKSRKGGKAKGGNIFVILKTIYEMARLWLELRRKT